MNFWFLEEYLSSFTDNQCKAKIVTEAVWPENMQSPQRCRTKVVRKESSTLLQVVRGSGNDVIAIVAPLKIVIRQEFWRILIDDEIGFLSAKKIIDHVIASESSIEASVRCKRSTLGITLKPASFNGFISIGLRYEAMLLITVITYKKNK